MCSRDVPWVAQEEQRFGPFHPEHLPPPNLPGEVLGTQFTSTWDQGGQDPITPEEGFQVINKPCVKQLLVSCGGGRRPAGWLRKQHARTIRLLVWETLEDFFAILDCT